MQLGNIKRQCHIDTSNLLHIAAQAKDVMQPLDLTLAQIDDTDVASISHFFADMVASRRRSP
ncbi:hypothetical protein JBE27_54775 [Streptomyces albiflaviniger]|nr:hypothetical protein [Streptomyces albiflaviniger]